MNKKFETINIRPAPMSIERIVSIYKVLTEPGKVGFVECFPKEEDQAVIREALDAAGELLYTLGGLHVIDGKCIRVSLLNPYKNDDNDKGCGDYTIQTERRKYKIRLSIFSKYESIPPNTYPNVGDRVVVKAEQLALKRGIYHGYAELCNVVKDDAEAEQMINANNCVMVQV